MTQTTKPRPLTKTMRDVLARMAELTDAPLEWSWNNGWRFIRTVKPGGANEWPDREWLGYAPTLTVEALERRGLVEVKFPRTTPGLHATTAYLTDAGRAALAEPAR